jgi:hypothetical protein
MRALYAEACLRACRRSSDIRVLSTRRRRAVRQLSGLRVPFCMLLFCLVSTSLSAPCPLKDHSSCQLVFHQWNVSPILVCSSREGIVHLRRGLRPLRYHVHAQRAALQVVNRCARRLSLSDQHAAFPRLDRRPAECFLTEDFYQDASSSRRRVG